MKARVRKVPTVDIPSDKYDQATLHLERATALMQLALINLDDVSPEIIALHTALESVIAADKALCGDDDSSGDEK